MYIVCAHCAAINNVPDARLHDAPVCGKCKQAVLPAQPISHNYMTLPAFLNAAKQPVLFDFWATWCGPCQNFAPYFAQAGAQRPGIHFVKIDVDACPEVASACTIRSVPTLILFKDAEEVERIAGGVSVPQLLKWLDHYAA